MARAGLAGPPAGGEHLRAPALKRETVWFARADGFHPPGARDCVIGSLRRELAACQDVQVIAVVMGGGHAAKACGHECRTCR